MIDEKELKISKYCRVLQRDDLVILCNIQYGNTIKISRECWEIIENNIKNYTIDEILNATADEEDRVYMKNLIENCISAKILVKNEEDTDDIESIDFIITNRCNLQCIHCCANAETAVGKDILTTDIIKKIADEILTLNLKSIVITGGEPMLRDDFFEIANYIRDRFSGHMTLMSNGLLISNKNVDEIIRIFDGIDLSLDGYDEESCSKIRGKGVFTKVISVVNLLIEKGFKSNNISLSMVETAYTYETEKFIELNKKLGTIPSVRVFSPIGRGKINNEKLNINRVKKEIKNNAVEKENDTIEMKIPPCRTCSAGEHRIAINHKGEIYPCMLLDYPKYCLGDIFNIDNLGEYLTKKLYKKTKGYENLKSITPECRNKCSKCDIYAFCIYCLSDIHRYIEDNTLDEVCKMKKSEWEYIWKV